MTRLTNISQQVPVMLLMSSALVISAHAKKNACDFFRYKPLVVSEVALVDAAIKKVEPGYPATGPKVRVQGDVTVKILVDRKGNVSGACAIDGHPLLRPSAVYAAVQWKFKPNRRYVQSFIVF